MNAYSYSCDTDTDIGLSPAPAVRERTSGFQGFLIRLCDRAGEWHDRAASRRALARLDGRMLADIGVDPAWAEAEAARPFWRE